MVDSKVCIECGIVFTARDNHAMKGRVYCSRACSARSRLRRVLLTCVMCGSPFSRVSSQVDKGGGLYCSRECANEGKRISVEEQFRVNVAPPNENGCMLWRGYVQLDGYGQVGVAGKTKRAHCVAYELAYGPIPEGKQINHYCDVRNCCNPEHLYVGSQQDNIRDAVRRNRHVKGERVGGSKLVAHQVRMIRYRYAEGGISQRQLANTCGVHKSTVTDILMGRTWRHVV